jgi:hypothetical protein
MGSKLFDVLKQVGGRVDREIRAEFAGMGRASTAPALIKEDNSVGTRIKEATHAGGTSRTGATMENDHRFTAWVPTCFPVHAISIADIQQAMSVRLDFRIERPHGLHLLHAPAHRKPHQ